MNPKTNSIHMDECDRMNEFDRIGGDCAIDWKRDVPPKRPYGVMIGTESNIH